MYQIMEDIEYYDIPIYNFPYDVEEDDGEGGAGYTESELGHGLALGGAHPIPLPGMSMVPAGYTTFQHNALYGGQPADERSKSRSKSGGERKQAHAGVVHGQSVGRLPLPMGMGSMVNTVSSTVSVGPSARRSGRRF